MELTEHLKVLGMKAEDRVTGISGVIDCVSFDLYGCIQVTLRRADKDGNCIAGWYDIGRLKITGKSAVMSPPDFDIPALKEGRKGPAHKPIP